MDKIKLEAIVDKETKNTIRYAEVVEEGEEAVFRSIYVSKKVTGSPHPEEIKVTIEPVAGASKPSRRS